MFCIDVKLRKRWQIEKWFDELREYASKHDKIAILTLRKPHAKHRLVVIDFDFLIAMLKGAGLID